ncbi:MAG: hypothetical protein U0835_13880 [Isosphaeraceae bacterium]
MQGPQGHLLREALTLTIHEAKVLVDAVRKHDRVLQTGSQQRSEYDGKFRVACEYVRSGRIGKLLTVHVGVGAPSVPCDLGEEATEPGSTGTPGRPRRSAMSVQLGRSPRGVHKHFPAWRNYREYRAAA